VLLRLETFYTLAVANVAFVNQGFTSTATFTSEAMRINNVTSLSRLLDFINFFFSNRYQ
jgi:hypothetical protein